MSRTTVSLAGPCVTDRVLERLADGLMAGLLSVDRERDRLIGYVASFCPASDAKLEKAKHLILKLSDDDPDVRDRATRELTSLGRPALLAVRDFDRERLCPETLTRLARVRRALEPYEGVCSDGEWERDVVYLARLRDPRATERLERILAATDLPGSSLDRLPAHWMDVRDRYRWDPTLDRYIERR